MSTTMASDREASNLKQPAPPPRLYEPKMALDREKQNDKQPVPQDSSSRLIRSHYENQLAFARENKELNYDEPTPEDRRRKEAEIQKLHDAARVLLDLVRRRQYDMRLRHDARKQTSRHAASECDTWIAARDGRDWPTPPKHRESRSGRREAFRDTRAYTRDTHSPSGRGSPDYEPYLP
ncbi:hypothetical protein AC578_4146 [Pseudocercospora eumusae]|uniref:Uncharacterized protein n=1 Tax=Pseudocercospora eumusae TaxID=321146 RepID=A0A139GWE9_9PEZI|nr:hypothetical protein AC578_4146 [Pseudocercospora eumusae]